MKAVIIDDEPKVRTHLKNLLAKYCRQVEVIGEAGNAYTGGDLIQESKPDLVFLDIQMPKGSGFDLLASLGAYEFDVIFVTGYDQYAIQAVKCSALDYLLKPVKSAELIEAVAKAENNKRKDQIGKQIANLHNILQNPHKNDHRIAIPFEKDFCFINLSEVIRLEASRNYTKIFLEGNKKMLTSKGIGFYDEILSGYGFIRCHQSHLVNREFIKNLHNGKVVFELILADGYSVPISSRKIGMVRETLIKDR